MVANHFRWDFYGLSTDTKPDATNPRVADGSTYYEANTSKLYVWYKDQWYEKEAGGSYELPIASAETLGGVKVGEGLAIDEGGVLSASGGGGGEAGAFKTLTSADYNYPVNNPTYVALWLLPPGTYFVDNSADVTTNVKVHILDSGINTTTSLFQVYKTPSNTSRVMINAYGNTSDSDNKGTFGFRQYRVTIESGSLFEGYVYSGTSLV